MTKIKNSQLFYFLLLLIYKISTVYKCFLMYRLQYINWLTSKTVFITYKC